MLCAFLPLVDFSTCFCLMHFHPIIFKKTKYTLKKTFHGIYINTYSPVNVITTRKRSLGQGNVFTHVYHSIHRGAGCIPTCTWVGVWPGGEGDVHPPAHPLDSH